MPKPKLYINGREIEVYRIDTSWYPDLSIEKAWYVDTGEEVDIDDLDSVDSISLHYYWSETR